MFEQRKAQRRMTSSVFDGSSSPLDVNSRIEVVTSGVESAEPPAGVMAMLAWDVGSRRPGRGAGGRPLARRLPTRALAARQAVRSISRSVDGAHPERKARGRSRGDLEDLWRRTKVGARRKKGCGGRRQRGEARAGDLRDARARFCPGALLSTRLAAGRRCSTRGSGSRKTWRRSVSIRQVEEDPARPESCFFVRSEWGPGVVACAGRPQKQSDRLFVPTISERILLASCSAVLYEGRSKCEGRVVTAESLRGRVRKPASARRRRGPLAPAGRRSDSLEGTASLALALSHPAIHFLQSTVWASPRPSCACRRRARCLSRPRFLADYRPRPLAIRSTTPPAFPPHPSQPSASSPGASSRRPSPPFGLRHRLHLPTSPLASGCTPGRRSTLPRSRPGGLAPAASVGDRWDLASALASPPARASPLSVLARLEALPARPSRFSTTSSPTPRVRRDFSLFAAASGLSG